MREEIREILCPLNSSYHRRKAEEGKKIAGHLCAYIPQEIIASFDAVPFRLRASGSRSTRKADVHFSQNHCSFVRHLFNQALNGEYGFLDTVILGSTCDHGRRIYDNWLYRELRPSNPLFVPLPHVSGKDSIKGFAEDLRRLAEQLERRLDTPFSEENLRRSIAAYNSQRRLIGELNELRLLPRPPVTGAEMRDIYQCLASMTVKDGTDLLTSLLAPCRSFRAANSAAPPQPAAGNPAAGQGKKRPSGPGSRNGAAPPLRILYASGPCEDPVRLDIIEGDKLLVAADTTCIGTGQFDGLTEERGDPFENLARRLLCSYTCPKIIDRIRERVDYFFALYEGQQCDAVIIDPLQFCSYWAAEGFIYEKEAEKRGIPLLRLSHELYGGGAGQLRTRIEAFTEQILNSLDPMPRKEG